MHSFGALLLLVVKDAENPEIADKVGKEAGRRGATQRQAYCNFLVIRKL